MRLSAHWALPAIGLTLLLGACGTSKDSTTDAATTAGALTGTWEGCEAMDDDSSKVVIVASGAADATLTSTQYSDKTCTTKTIEFAFTGTYTVGAEVADGAKKVDIKYTKIMLTLTNPDIVKTFNAEAYCGKTDWTASVPVNVFGIANCLTKELPRDMYNIYKIDGTKLYLGLKTETLDTSTDAKRPTALDTTNFLTKK